MNRARAFVVLVASLLAAGCSAGVRMTAPVDDYAAYRRVRLAPTEGERLRAAQDYLAARPSGTFAAELRALFDGEEPRYFDAAKESRAGTLAYLTHLPQGPHAEAAAILLVAWDTRIEEGEMASLLKEARRTEALLASAATQRQAVGETVFEALRSLADPAAYGVPLGEAPLALRRFLSGGEGPTWGRMPDKTTRDLFFVVPTSLERESRVATLSLAVEIDRGVVTAGRVYGPDLFVHWLEADAMRALDPTDPRSRARAAAHARERLEGFFEALLPKARCTPPPDAAEPPGLLARRCDGWTLSVHAGARAGDDDTVTLARRP